MRKIPLLLALAGLALIAVDFFHEKETHFDFETWPGFYAGYGFLAGVAAVALALALRPLLVRKEDYGKEDEYEEGRSDG